MTARRGPRPLRSGAGLPTLMLGANFARLPTELERGNAERARIYTSARWRRDRRTFLLAHPLCTGDGKPCGAPARVVDHVDGHRHPDWRARFWDRSRWAPLCLACHAVKSGRELQDWRRSGEASAYRGAEGGRTSSRGRRGDSRTVQHARAATDIKGDQRK